MNVEWIPVSERLPEEETQYLCVVDRFIFDSKEKCREHYYKICRYAKDLYSVDKYDFMHKKGANGFYVYDSEYGYILVNDIIAWMPIPKYETVTIADYCINDVLATEAVFNARKEVE